MKTEETTPTSPAPTTEPTAEDWAKAIEHLKEIGFLVDPPPAGPPDPNFKPIFIPGEPLSETIIRERR